MQATNRSLGVVMSSKCLLFLDFKLRLKINPDQTRHIVYSQVYLQRRPLTHSNITQSCVPSIASSLKFLLSIADIAMSRQSRHGRFDVWVEIDGERAQQYGDGVNGRTSTCFIISRNSAVSQQTHLSLPHKQRTYTNIYSLLLGASDICTGIS